MFPVRSVRLSAGTHIEVSVRRPCNLDNRKKRQWKEVSDEAGMEDLRDYLEEKGEAMFVCLDEKGNQIMHRHDLTRRGSVSRPTVLCYVHSAAPAVTTTCFPRI